MATATALNNFSEELASLVAAVAPRVVSVRARRHYPASGLRWSANLVVTAAQAIQRDVGLAVTFADGQTVAAQLVGRDLGSDLALLRLESPAPLGAEMPPAAGTRAGELALVVGRSPDSGVNASCGIVAAASGPWRTWRGARLDTYLRLDARMFPQSAGAAVVNARGQLIGLASAALSRLAGLAVPLDTVRRVAEELERRGFVPRPYLGLGAQPVALPEALRSRLGLEGETGLLVVTVEPGGPAERAGVLLGDVITAIAGVAVGGFEELQRHLDAAAIGAPLALRLVRGGAAQEATVAVGERPARSA